MFPIGGPGYCVNLEVGIHISLGSRVLIPPPYLRWTDAVGAKLLASRGLPDEDLVIQVRRSKTLTICCPRQCCHLRGGDGKRTCLILPSPRLIPLPDQHFPISASSKSHAIRSPAHC